MAKKLTINDIAEMSGVAKSTVSRYLNGGSVRKSTSQRIKKVIEENDYEPNVFARLNAKNSQIIGLVVPGFNSVTTPRLVEVIVAYLKQSGYTPLIMHTGDDTSEEVRSIARLNNMKVDGIMVLSVGITDDHVRTIQDLDIPVLFLGQNYPGVNTVVNDDYNAGFAIGRYIADQGAQDVIGLWVSEKDPAVGRDRKQGVLDGLRAGGIESADFYNTTFFYEDSVANIRKILSERKRPDAIICATDRIAEGVYRIAPEFGIRIGKDLSVTGFGDYETSELLNPPLTTVRFDWYNWGCVSAETILQMIQQKPVSRIQVIPYEIIERESVKQKK